MIGIDARASLFSEAERQPIRVLHAAAHEGVRDRVAELLTPEDGFVTTTVSGRTQALDALEHTDVDCIVSGAVLSDGCGLDLLVSVRESAPLCPFILFTASGSEVLASDAISAGVTAYLIDESDPSSLDRLATAVTDAVESSRRERHRRRLASIPEVSPDVTMVCAADGRITYTNPSVSSVLAYTPAELIGTHLAELAHPADQPLLRRTLSPPDSSSLTGATLTWRCRAADGASRVFESRLSDPPDRGLLDGVVVTSRDVTDRADLETALARTMDRMSDAFLAVDREFTIVELNDHAAHLCGVTRDAVRGRSLWDVFPGAVDSPFQEAYEVALSRGDPVAFTEYFDPLETWFEVHAFPDQTGMSIYFGDVTEQQSLRQTVEHDRHLLAGLFESSPVAVVVIDDQGQIIRANSRAETHLGLERSEITARTYDQPEWQNIDVAGEPLSPEELPVARALAAGEPVFDAEHGIVLSDGRLRWLSVSAVPFTTTREKDGDPAEHVVAAFADVTERRDREDALTTANEQLEILNRILRHDIHNDMALISGWAQLLKKRLDADSQALDQILDTTRSVIELTETTKQVLDVVTEDADPPLAPVALAPVLTREATKQAAMHESATITLESVPPSLSVVATDMLGTVFRNVLSNAITHNPAETPTVDVRVAVTDDTVTVAVTDDGPGIPDSISATAFEREVTGLGSQGTGIGLYLVTKLMEQFGGAARVADTSAAGTTVELAFTRGRLDD